MYAINKILYSEGRKAATTIGLTFEYRHFETQIKWFFMYSRRCRVSTCADCDAHALKEPGCSGDLINEGYCVIHRSVAGSCSSIQWIGRRLYVRKSFINRLIALGGSSRRLIGRRLIILRKIHHDTMR